MRSRFSRLLLAGIVATLLTISGACPTSGIIAATTTTPPASATPAVADEHIDLLDIVSGKFTRLAFGGTRLYAGEDMIDHGALSIFNIGSGVPQLLSRTELPGVVASISLSGTRAYLALNPNGGLPILFALDVS